MRRSEGAGGRALELPRRLDVVNQVVLFLFICYNSVMKRTKIIATIGPASQDVETLVSMIKAGMNVARLNFSHGDYASHAKLIQNIRAASQKTGQPVGIIQDLSGPKLRLGEFADKTLKAGEHLVLGHGGIPVARHIWEWVKTGQSILIDDGLVELVTLKVHQDSLEARVLVGGKIISHKGVSLPGVKVDLPAISEKDKADLEFGLKMGVDFVAMSFVKDTKDLTKLRSTIKRISGKTVPVVAKIETPEALKNIDNIIKSADAVMVARGDLALNIPQAKEAVAQKEIVTKCVRQGTPVIMATQMLDSMIRNPRPTRAELSDVANAVIDHVDCVMLSGESAFGKYPLKAVETMSNIIQETEKSAFDDYVHSEKFAKKKALVAADKVIHAMSQAHLQAIVVANFELAKNVSRFRPESKIVFLSNDEGQLRLAGLYWGVIPVLAQGSVNQLLKRHNLVSLGQHYLNATKVHKKAVVKSVA